MVYKSRICFENGHIFNDNNLQVLVLVTKCVPNKIAYEETAGKWLPINNNYYKLIINHEHFNSQALHPISPQDTLSLSERRLEIIVFNFSLESELEAASPAACWLSSCCFKDNTSCCDCVSLQKTTV